MLLLGALGGAVDGLAEEAEWSFIDQKAVTPGFMWTLQYTEPQNYSWQAGGILQGHHCHQWINVCVNADLKCRVLWVVKITRKVPYKQKPFIKNQSLSIIMQ